MIFCEFILLSYMRHTNQQYDVYKLGFHHHLLFNHLINHH